MSIGRLGGTLELLELIELSLWNCPPAVLEPSSWNFSPRTLHLELFLELQHSSCNSTPGKGARTLHRLYSGSKSDPQSGPKGAPPKCSQKWWPLKQKWWPLSILRVSANKAATKARM